jgi:ABC-type spermidine/putrescine transport system permease subunit II
MFTPAVVWQWDYNSAQRIFKERRWQACALSANLTVLSRLISTASKTPMALIVAVFRAQGRLSCQKKFFFDI